MRIGIDMYKIIDNFFDNPDEVRKFALDQLYEKDNTGSWPGARTREIAYIDSVFFNTLFNFLEFSPTEYRIVSNFQLTGESYEEGWVHKDKSLYTGIFYLNKDPIANSGTSLYLDNECDTKFSDEKKQWIFGNKTSEEISKFRDENNNQFKEIQNLENVYNRLIIFPGTVPHRANKFFGTNKEDSRLTLVFFVFEREKC
jgi:hypothetical protein